MAANVTLFDDFNDGTSALQTTAVSACRADKIPTGMQVTIEVIFLALISIMGTFGNILIIIAMAITPVLRTTANYFIFALAVIDAFNTGVLSPIFIFTLVKGEWPYEALGCKFLGYMTLFTMALSEMTLVLLAATRYLIVTKPKRVFTRYCQVKFMVIYMTLIILMGMVILTMPEWTDIGRIGFNHIVAHCTFVFCTKGEWWYGFMLIMCLLLVNICVIPFFYLLTFHAVAKSKRTIKAVQMTNGVAPDRSYPSLSPQEIQLTKRLLVLFLIFVICWLPYSIVILTDSKLTTNSLAYQISNLLVWLSSGLNPYIYSFRNQNFRKAFKRILTSPWRKCTPRRSRGVSLSEHFGNSMTERKASSP